MEESVPTYLLLSDVVFMFLALICYVADVILDVWTVVNLYKEQNFCAMGLLIFLLLSSSALIQLFSWLWYSDSNRNLETKVESFISSHGLLPPVHIFGLGVFLRFMGIIENTTRSYKKRDRFHKAGYLNHDLSMLRLFAAFSENTPQLVLMIALTVQMQDLQLYKVLKIVGSLSSLSFTVLSYHRSMRAFLPDKFKMGWFSSGIYFLWNLFLISPRVTCVSLFASALPCYVASHFLFLWTLLVLWAWWQKAAFMDSKAGEWLYRATVGLIWYFSWFNVASGSTKVKGIIYHVAMAADTMLLLGLWWWRRSVESARLTPLPINPYLLIAILVISYITGILLKLVYYWKCHPNKAEIQIGRAEENQNPEMEQQRPQKEEAYYFFEHTYSDETPTPLPEPTVTPSTPRNPTGFHKRMKIMAENFYN